MMDNRVIVEKLDYLTSMVESLTVTVNAVLAQNDQKKKKDDDGLTLDDIKHNPPEWKSSLKINTHQDHENYMLCVNWWLANATAEYKKDLAKCYPAVDIKAVKEEMVIWLKSHTEFKDRRKDLNLTLRNTWLGRRQKWINKNQRFQTEKERSQAQNKEVAL